MASLKKLISEADKYMPKMRPTVSSDRTQMMSVGLKKIGKAGVKVGSVVKKGASAPFKWAGKQIEKELKMNKAKDDRYRKEGKALNRKYSGK